MQSSQPSEAAPAPAPAPLAYSIADACRVTSLKKTRLYQLVNAGKLDIVKVGKRSLIPAASLSRLIAEGC